MLCRRRYLCTIRGVEEIDEWSHGNAITILFDATSHQNHERIKSLLGGAAAEPVVKQLGSLEHVPTQWTRLVTAYFPSMAQQLA